MTQWENELTELAPSRDGALVGYAYSLYRDRTQAEDLVQDALVKVFSRLRRPTVDESGEGTTKFLVSDPITVDLDSGVAPLPSFAPPSDDCSGAAYAGRDLVAPGSPEDVRAVAARLLEAITTCDERLVVGQAGNNLETASTNPVGDCPIGQRGLRAPGVR